MNAKRASILYGATVLTACVLITAPGCGGSFLGLEDYQRDLLGSLAAALLFRPASDGMIGDALPGSDGVNCWDLNGNGLGDPEEDANGDGAFDVLDCAGEPGSPGRDGSNDVRGLNCWDLNGNGIADPAEDVNGDGDFNALDCQGQPGAPGADGPSGSSGSNGVDGQELFHVLVDDFFAAAGTPNGSLPIEVVSIDEPVLGVFPTAAGTTVGVNAVAYRVAVPELYNTGNDVGMRIAFHRTGPFTGGCFAIRLVAKRLRNGSGVEDYGTPRWIRIDLSAEVKAAAGEGGGSLVVLDLPLNTAAGLDLPGDLASADFLAFELSTHQNDGGAYQLLTVEFSESRPGTSALGGATIFSEEPDGDVPCGFDDCNRNGFADSEDIADERSNDCNDNGTPDVCEIAEGTEAPGGPFFCTSECDPNVNGNGIPDACEDIATLEGIWRFELPLTGECGQGEPAGVQTEIRYLRFDGNNNLVENWIVLDTECLNFAYPSVNGPNLTAYRNLGSVSQDTDRFIIDPEAVFNPLTGSMHLEESVTVGVALCLREEGITTLDGDVSGDEMSGTWEFRMAVEVFEQCISFPSIVCGTFTAVRVAGPPDCSILTPEIP